MLLRNATIYEENYILPNSSLEVKDGKISSIGNTKPASGHVISLPSHYHVIPGFIDLHIHGAGGADTMDATQESLATIAKHLAIEGTTSFLATTMTQECAQIEAALANVNEYIHTPTKGAEVLGIHLEGPFLSEKKPGAQAVKHITKGTVEQLKHWQEIAGGNIRLVTLAPEEDDNHALTTYLKETGVIASVGHSNATYAEVEEAVQHGVSHVTHLFNQMSGMHHREPGVVGAAMLNEDLMVELIADGHHVAPPILKLAYKQIGNERLMLISDAMRAACMEEGTYELGGQQVTVNKDARLEDGTLAGSLLTLQQACKNMMSYTSCSLQDVIQMASYNPAKQLGMLDRKGSIKVGKDADIVVLDDQFNVYMTIVGGEVI